MRSSRSIQLLCLALAALVLVLTHPPGARLWPLTASFAAFTAVILVLRAGFLLPRSPDTKLSIETWSMLIFITAVLWFSGKSASPLLNLYLLPVILGALTLGRTATLLQIAAICVCHLLLAAATPGVEVNSLAYTGEVVAQLAPFLLVAYLTTTLSADISKARERIEDLAQNDPLTGLYNLRTFNEIWQRQHAVSERDKGVYAVLKIDMDKLKDINDGFGHDAGNSAITLVAECLNRSIRNTDTAARLDGDEFAVLLPGATPEIAETVIKRVRNNVYKTTLDLHSRMIRCSVSIGVVNYPKDGRDLRILSNAARRNMNRDKELRRAPGGEARMTRP